MVNPAALTIVENMMGNEQIVVDARRVARAVVGVSLMIAIPFGGAVVYNAHQISQIESLSASMETVIAGQSLLQAAHANGVASGLTIGGVHVPGDLVNRISTIVEAEVISSARVLSEARMSGLEAALSGNWTAERLQEYVSLIETADPDLGRILTEETDRLSGSGVQEDQARTLIRAMAVKLMSGEPLEAAGTSSRVVTGSDAERAGVLGRAQTRIWSRLEETNRVGGLDTTLTREMAITIVGRMLDLGSAYEVPTP
jgi:hypothetical protein